MDYELRITSWGFVLGYGLGFRTYELIIGYWYIYYDSSICHSVPILGPLLSVRNGSTFYVFNHLFKLLRFYALVGLFLTELELLLFISSA